MEFLLGLIIGFVIMLILVALSCLPIFIIGHIKKQYSNGIGLFLTVLCTIIYIVLRVLCQECGILDDNNTAVPIFAIILIYLIAKIYTRK